MTLYLDASVIVPLLIVEPGTPVILRWLEASPEPLCVGRLAVGEVGAAISRRRRMDELSDDDGLRTLAALDEWLALSVDVFDHEQRDIAEAARLVRRPVPKLLTTDAIHLATCRRLGMRLVTADKGLTIVAEFLGIDWALPS